MTYDGIATTVVAEHHHGNTWYPPGYPLFLAVIYTLFGPKVIILRIIQAVVGALTCVVTYLLARRLFNEREGVLAYYWLSIQGTCTCPGGSWANHSTCCSL